ncbi:hypothetical protein Ais01nite_15440 [Asanoa ishikariensis]|uniref:DUF1440 domain-containing protein n=1 Tax=Asanoa ishikariensis TaxID=137265 RepID=A0A1H3UHB1_9ACTN|nr:hypothetical protein [Asanoa ishikariensis]GIF63509.1 hypothetical protein Ais01nite_15440 [Asanoa ishikariensis]SDZ61872.1 hypothetical protein SAMN05421684_7329 [Asanoa ishikariensis]
MDLTLLSGATAGAAAGAAGCAALDATTYIDMAVRGRPASDVPAETAEAIVKHLPVDVPGQNSRRQNRFNGLGGLSGVLSGVSVGVAFGLLHGYGWRPPLPVGAAAVGLGAMVVSDGTLAGLKVSDPRTWSATDWLSDLIPHLVYGAVTYATLVALEGRR